MSYELKMREMTHKYFNLCRELKKNLFDEWVLGGVSKDNCVEYSENDQEINEMYDWAFDLVIDCLAHRATKNEIKKILIDLHNNDFIGNLSAVEVIAEYLISKQKDLQKIRTLALEEQKRYPNKEINRIKRINDELNEYLRIGEGIAAENSLKK
jgi:hypothetical protein